MSDKSKPVNWNDAATEARAKSEERKNRLEIFRANQAAKRAASMGIKQSETAGESTNQAKAK